MYQRVLPQRHLKRRRLAAVAAATACVAALGVASPAGAATASQTVNAGALNFLNGTPGNVAFAAVTLNGTDQTRTQAQPIDVGDATGSGAGWAISATSTTFTSGANTLPIGATTIQAQPTQACIAGSSCTLATNAITYPYNLPAGATAPTASKLYTAAAGTGMGNQTITPTWTLAVPATTRSSATPYTATWTYTLVSGP